MLGAIAAACAIVLFVSAHEAGHFFAAKAVGMRVTQFFFGFGPRIWSTRRGGTEYGFKWIPLGGYVRIIGMNPLEEVEPEDAGRTYREKKFWEKSVVVLAGVGANFLIAFLMFYGVVLVNGVPGEITPEVSLVVEATPAEAVGIMEGDLIVGINGVEVDEWADLTDELGEMTAGPAEIVVARGGEEVVLIADLEGNHDGGAFLGVAPTQEILSVNPFEVLGYAGLLVWNGITQTFEALAQMVRPSSFAQYFGVLLGDTELDAEIRPVSPIGIVNIGSQVENVAFFVGILATVNVILATLNLLPLLPLDGGHFAVALYEKLTGREADVRRLAPVAAAVVVLFGFLGLVAIILDVADPISL